MHSNQKLTHVIAGRSIASITTASGVATIAFGDGSQMTVRCTPGVALPMLPTLPAHGGNPPAVKTVQQDLHTLRLTLQDGHTLDFPIAEPTSTVMVRNRSHAMEYAD